jgi:FixJ family two-component response regulator
VILLTAWTHLDRAVTLVKAGAADYLQKPRDDQRLPAAVGNLLELQQTSAALKASSRRPMAARCFWTRAATCRWPGR